MGEKQKTEKLIYTNIKKLIIAIISGVVVKFIVDIIYGAIFQPTQIAIAITTIIISVVVIIIVWIAISETIKLTSKLIALFFICVPLLLFGFFGYKYFDFNINRIITDRIIAYNSSLQIEKISYSNKIIDVHFVIINYEEILSQSPYLSFGYFISNTSDGNYNVVHIISSSKPNTGWGVLEFPVDKNGIYILIILNKSFMNKDLSITTADYPFYTELTNINWF